MALEGSLKDFGLADIFQLIHFQRKTGILILTGRMDKVKVLFIEGNITGAESKRRIEDNRLGKILLKKGFIKEADLRAAMEEQKGTVTKLGNILIRKELVKKEIVNEILKSQITETVIQLFGWKQGTYEFSTQGVPQDKEFSFSLDTQHLLMEGLRIVDEWSLIKGRLTLDTVFIKKIERPSNMTEEEEEIFAYVDGENDVSTIKDLSYKDNFEVSKILLTLAEKGIVETIEAAPVVKEEMAIETKKPLAFLNYLPVVAIIVSLVLSLSVVMIQHVNILKDFEASGKIEDLRFRIEAYRLEYAAYPLTLDLISDSRDPWGKSYIYRVSDNLFYLVSTGADGKEGTEDDIY